jgi:hypothetical protein
LWRGSKVRSFGACLYIVNTGDLLYVLARNCLSVAKELSYARGFVYQALWR